MASPPALTAKHEAVRKLVDDVLDMRYALLPNTHFLAFKNDLLYGLDPDRWSTLNTQAVDTKSDLYAILRQEYSGEALARHAGREFNIGKSEATALLKIHQIWVEARDADIKSDWFNPKRIWAPALAATSILASQVPQEALQVMDINYSSYRLFLFIVLCLAAVVTFLLWRSTRRDMARGEAAVRGVTMVLTYLDAIEETETSTRIEVFDIDQKTDRGLD